jgi:Cu-Zn family superoxide dismutase
MRTVSLAAIFVVGLSCAACGSDDDDESKTDSGVDSGARLDAGHDAAAPGLDSGPGADAGVLAKSEDKWTIFPFGDGGLNPASGIQGTATATRTAAGGTHLVLSVSGLPANHAFGSHLHKLACSDMQAGGHYENVPYPADSGANDPAYANPTNELWFDFTTNASGSATATSDVAWIPKAGGAKAIVVHEHTTTDGGVAGAKLACVGIPF